MRSRSVSLKSETEPGLDSRIDGHVVGRIVSIDEDGSAWVDFPDNPRKQAIKARSALDAAAPIGSDPQRLVEAPALLAFENGDPSLPIILGLVRDRVRPEARPPEVKITGKGLRDVLIDG